MKTTAMTESTTCDLCGYGGPYSEPHDFVQNGGYDFCRWCAFKSSGYGTLSTGGHAVELNGPDEAWQCSCGRTYGEVVLKLRLAGVSSAVMEAVPGDLLGATASLHINTPNWPGR